MTLQPGKLYEARFRIRNIATVPVVAQAVPSVAPATTAKYLQKTECFCFTPQSFAALGGTRIHRPLHRGPRPAASRSTG